MEYVRSLIRGRKEQQCTDTFIAVFRGTYKLHKGKLQPILYTPDFKLMFPHPVIGAGRHEASSSLHLLPVHTRNSHCVAGEGSQAEGDGEEREKSIHQGSDQL